MKDNEIIKKIKSYKWEKWVRRPFNPFVLSLFKESLTKKYFEKIGLKGVQCEAFIFQDGEWLRSEKVMSLMANDFKKYFKNHSIKDIINSFENFYKKNKKIIKKLVKEKKDAIKKLRLLSEIYYQNTTYIWAAHGLEKYYDDILKNEVPKYIKKDIDKFIGDASFPKKKNSHALMDEAIIKGISSKKIVEEFGWIKSRNGFNEPFTTKDIIQLRKSAKGEKEKRIAIPKPLKKIFDEVQELVYFRTARTDAFFEFLHIARPIFKEVAKLYNIKFDNLKYYTVQSLIQGKPKKYNINFSCANWKGNMIYSAKKIINIREDSKTDLVKGNIAYKGKVRGVAKVVKFVQELDKVKEGDVLVTQMTFPSFILAMKRAAAFVTDEGGITCHAAIVAREMKKPCIIGTKNATGVFKDGDLVEVDAEKGVVKIIKQ